MLKNHLFRHSPKGGCIRKCAGFTYLGLLILVAIIGIASTATLQVGSLMQRRMAEEELLYIGMEYRKALLSYANATPAGQKHAPASLQDLVKDSRSPNPRRHLRRIYPDPITGKEEWGIIEAVDGSGIVGVYSLSDAKPIKVDNFDGDLKEFAGKTSYRDWRFLSLSQSSIPAQKLQGRQPETPTAPISFFPPST